ncbi:hypothetical protein HYDPIDRAFT_170821 [Hydnomerulius pinastri MD-312]|uniref:Uncharacterized protein n=1 Tax=Hydnomerulius pinastri MD-312 TaxID=994086 RepID=A0A0C9VNW4_9AGAM|nr:hypothetical protein HYDPIDRAFT_170821 [Hydnomerulius pinastri MD-312]
MYLLQYQSSSNVTLDPLLNPDGGYMLATFLLKDEDVIEALRDFPYTNNIHNALSPEAHQHLPRAPISPQKITETRELRQLPDQVLWQLHIGGMRPVANWFFHHDPGVQRSVHRWLGCAPFAHALTLLIARRHQRPASSRRDSLGGTTNSLDLDAAWKRLVDDTGTAPNEVDVDVEGLMAFERWMFEDSVQAGAAGN